MAEFVSIVNRLLLPPLFRPAPFTLVRPDDSRRRTRRRLHLYMCRRSPACANTRLRSLNSIRHTVHSRHQLLRRLDVTVSAWLWIALYSLISPSLQEQGQRPVLNLRGMIEERHVAPDRSAGDRWAAHREIHSTSGRTETWLSAKFIARRANRTALEPCLV